MKNLIIVLMVFTAVFCYSQAKPDNAPKEAFKSVSIEQFKELKEAVKKLADSDKKLKAENIDYRKKLNERDKLIYKRELELKLQSKKNLTAIQIVNTAETAFNNRADDIKTAYNSNEKDIKNHSNYMKNKIDFFIAIMSILIMVVLFCLGLHVWRNSRDSEKIKEQGSKIDTAVNNNKELETKIESHLEDIHSTLGSFFINKELISSTNEDKFSDLCLAVNHCSKTNSGEKAYKGENLEKRVEAVINSCNLETLKDMLRYCNVSFNGAKESLTIKYYNFCQKIITDRIALLENTKKKPDKN